MKSFLLSIPKGLPSVIMVVLVLYFTFAPNPFYINSLKVFPFAEQLGHLVLYFVTAMVFICDYAKARLPHHSKVNKEIALMIFTHGFNYDISNVYAAFVGATIAFLFYHFWLYHPFRHYLYHTVQHHWRYQHRRKKKSSDKKFKL